LTEIPLPIAPPASAQAWTVDIVTATGMTVRLWEPRPWVAVPRVRLRAAAGRTEWQSQNVPRYQRRTARMDEAILGFTRPAGIAGGIRAAWAPLSRPLSKHPCPVGRAVGRLLPSLAAPRSCRRTGALPPARPLVSEGGGWPSADATAWE